MSLSTISPTYLRAIESELRRQIDRLNEPRYAPFHAMLTYHMGWTGEGAGPEAAGKRIRPLLLLLVCTATGGNWLHAVPAAAAVELIHNFSLVHDDIQDNSEKRRNRPTVWKIWGMPQGINAGDVLFVLANQSLLDLSASHPAETILQAGHIFQQTCLNLTKGQYLDMSYETRTDLQESDYWAMIAGKTAALLSACTQIGALLGGSSPDLQEAYRDFGHYLGLAFQVQDDILGIWGEEALTGKSTASDLLEGKKSLPVLYGLHQNGAFAQMWAEGPIRAEKVTALAEELAREGARLYAQEAADRMTELALQSLRRADPQGEAGEALFELAAKLLGRQN